MKLGKPIRIVASGSYVPQKVTSTEIEITHNLPKGWAKKYSGVESRHHVSFETNGYMGARAFENALANSSLNPSDIDLLISASATFDYPLPCQASIIKSELLNSDKLDFGVVDIDASCLSFVSAFEYASALLNGDQYKTIAIVSSEISSKSLNPTNFETITLFGDGAVAFILQYDDTSDSCFYKAKQKNYTEGVYDSYVKGGGNKYHFKDYTYSHEMHSFTMNGKNLMRMAIKYLPAFTDDFFSDLSIELNSVDVIIPHQASQSGIVILERIFAIKSNQIKGNLKFYGNLIATSIPMLLHESIKNGSLKRGDLCFLVGSAAGFSLGGALLKF